MDCIYVLRSLRDNNRYIGSTNDLTKRLSQHNNGLVQSTKNRLPLVLEYCQEFESLIEARMMESKYKRSRGTYELAVKNGLLKKQRGVA